MLLTRREWPVFIVNLTYLAVFAAISARKRNIEFLLYVGVVTVLVGVILWKQRSIQFDRLILWGLTLWGFLHLSGGNITVGDGILYEVVLVPLIPKYHVLRYDQLIHLIGFGVATLLCHHLLRPFLRDGILKWGTLSFLLVLMGSGFGALNEIVEFIADETVPETYVGGYNNTMLDLVFNLFGALLAVMWLALRRRRECSQSD